MAETDSKVVEKTPSDLLGELKDQKNRKESLILGIIDGIQNSESGNKLTSLENMHVLKDLFGQLRTIEDKQAEQVLKLTPDEAEKLMGTGIITGSEYPEI